MPIVSIQDSNQTFEVNEGEILYDSLFDRGLELPHGCLAGSCGACRVEVVLGAENLVEPGVVEKDTIEALKKEIPNKAIRLSCRAKIIGDVTIRLIKQV